MSLEIDESSIPETSFEGMLLKLQMKHSSRVNVLHDKHARCFLSLLLKGSSTVTRTLCSQESKWKMKTWHSGGPVRE